MKSALNFVGLALGLSLGQVAQAASVTFTESTDVGQLIPSAPVISSAIAGDTLTAINGSMGVAGATSFVADDADLYGFILTAGVAFKAKVTSVGGTTGLFDSQLFLFDALGKGLVFNDDTSFANSLSTLNFTPTTSGLYFLAITNYNFDPRDANNNFIFPDTPITSFGTVSALTSPGVLASWAPQPGASDWGTYTISLTGATTVPEPASMAGLLALASGSWLRLRKRSKA